MRLKAVSVRMVGYGLAVGTFVERPIIDHTDGLGSFVCSPFLSAIGDRAVTLFHVDHDGPGGPTSNVYGIEIDDSLVAIGCQLCRSRQSARL